jgi:hypothetical protein
MSNPLTFLLPLRYDAVHTVLLVQSGPIDLALQAAARVRALFPACALEGLIRETDREAASGFDRVTVVRWEDRLAIVRRLRARRYDAVVVLLSNRGSDYLRMLPFLLRTGAILVFNDRLDYFPVHVTRLDALAHHLSGHASLGALLRWAMGRAIVVPLATLVLLASVARLYARAAWRRARA